MNTKKTVSLSPPLRTLAGRYLRQKDLANLFAVTTRQIRRWERQAEKEGRPFPKPYNLSGLARMFMMRRTHCWSRSWAEQLGLLDVFEEFENCTRQQIDSTPADHRELACTNLLLHLAGDHLPEGVEFFKLGPGTVSDAQVMLGLLMTYPPTAKRLTKAWREAICIYNMAMAGAGGISAPAASRVA